MPFSVQRAAPVPGSRFPVPTVRAALTAIMLWLAPVVAAAQTEPLRLDRSRFTVVAYPGDRQLAQSVLAAATANDASTSTGVTQRGCGRLRLGTSMNMRVP